jgi:hypothetical protein
VLSSGAQSRRGRITTRTDITEHIPITDQRRATACGTVTLGYPLASYDGLPDFAQSNYFVDVACAT